MVAPFHFPLCHLYMFRTGVACIGSWSEIMAGCSASFTPTLAKIGSSEPFALIISHIDIIITVVMNFFLTLFCDTVSVS
jgi:hypothetical protein